MTNERTDQGGVWYAGQVYPKFKSRKSDDKIIDINGKLGTIVWMDPDLTKTVLDEFTKK